MNNQYLMFRRTRIIIIICKLEWRRLLSFKPISKNNEGTGKSMSLLFLHQITHNITIDCLLNYQFSTWKLQTQNMLYTQIVLFQHSEQFMFTTCSELAIFMYWACNSMKNILSYSGLVDTRLSASEKDLPAYSTFIFSDREGFFFRDEIQLDNSELPLFTLYS